MTNFTSDDRGLLTLRLKSGKKKELSTNSRYTVLSFSHLSASEFCRREHESSCSDDARANANANVQSLPSSSSLPSLPHRKKPNLDGAEEPHTTTHDPSNSLVLSSLVCSLVDADPDPSLYDRTRDRVNVYLM